MVITQSTCPSMSLSDLFHPSRMERHWQETIGTLEIFITWRFDRLSPLLWIWLVFGLASFVDGITIARIGAYGFRYPSPIGYLTGIWLLGLSSLAFIILPLLPIVISLSILNMIALSFSVGLMMSARNLQKRL